MFPKNSVWLAMIGFALATPSANSQPSATSICDLAQYRGSAIYNRYCSGQSGPMAPSAPVYDPNKSFRALAINASGEFYVIKRGGRRLSAQDMANVPFEIGDTILTGPSGRTVILLPDETTFTIGPNSEMEIDEFVYDPQSSSVTGLFIGVTKGVFRFVTSHVQAAQDLRVKVAVMVVGIRGTDVEIEQTPDGSGSVKLHSGSAVLTPYDTDSEIALHPGQMVTWTDFANLSSPRPIQ